MIKAAIFDMDGLLIDSEPLWEKSDTYFLKSQGYVYTPELRMKMVGRGQREAIELLKKEFGFSSKEVNELIRERKKVFYEMFFKQVRLMEGVRELLERLGAKNLALAVATGGHSVKKTKEVLKSFNLCKHFSVLASSDQVEKGKPHPDVFLFTAKLLDVDPKYCLVLEDTVNGSLAGKAAGMKVFGVNKDKKIRKEIKECGVDGVFASLLEIKNI